MNAKPTRRIALRPVTLRASLTGAATRTAHQIVDVDSGEVLSSSSDRDAEADRLEYMVGADDLPAKYVAVSE